MALTAEQIYLLNNEMGDVPNKVQLGDLIDGAYDSSSVAQSGLDQRSISDEFDGPIIQTGPNGGALSTADTAVNLFMTPMGNVFESRIKTADSGASTAPYVTYDADGIDISMDQTNDDIYEMNNGITARSKVAFTASEDFFFETQIKVADVSGETDLAVGFRKAEAYKNAIDDYDEMAVVNVISGAIKIETILNNAATITTDTTQVLADTQYLKVRMEHKQSVGLASAIALANDLVIKYSAHIADATEHTTAADATNVISVAGAKDLTTLIALVTNLITKYDAHEGDAELGAAWVYHAAQEAGDHSLASLVAPTDLPTCIARLNDIKTKLNAHDADGTAHGTDTLHQVSQASASALTITKGINTATLTAPTVTAPFIFDAAEVVIPFLYYQFDAVAPGVIQVQAWKAGLL